MEKGPLRVVMMGTGGFAEPTFHALLESRHTVVGLVTQPDRVVGQERGSTRQAKQGMKEMAVARNLPVLQPENIKSPEALAAVLELKPEILVVAAYGQILSRDLLAAVPMGGINVHGSLLPKYRGAAPVAWAIYQGETQTGVTIIRMSAQLDAGDMLAQESIDIGPEETAGELEARLAPLGARLALQTLEAMLSGTIHGQKQDQSLVTKAPKLTKEHGIIDWTRPAPMVCNQVRAMQPWPTAYTCWHRSSGEPMRLILYRTRGHIESEETPAPGTVMDRPGLWIAAAPATAVEILELQPSGKRRMGTTDFLRGNRVLPGDRFGPVPQ